MQRVPLFIGRWKYRFAIFFIRTGDSPLFRQIGGVWTSRSRQNPPNGGRSPDRGGICAERDAEGASVSETRRRVTSFRYWRSVHMKTFRLLTAVSIAALVAASSAASAQQRTLYVAGYGGSFEKTIRDEVIPAFEKENGVKVEYVAGNSTDTLAKLQAQKGNQQIDVAIVDDGPMYQAIQLGFCGKLEGLPTDLYDTARFKDDRAVAIGIVATGLMYNTKVFAEKGWAPPTSWNDLKDTKYAKQLVIPPINNTYGLEALVMLSKMNGGGESNVDSGFKIFKEQINPNVLAYEPSPGKMTELFQSGQAVIAVWGTGRVQSFANTGFPVDFVYPKEGAATLLTTACPITKPNASPLASSFVKMLLDPKIQLVMLKDYGYGPVLKSLVIPPELGKMAPIGERAAKLYNPDWTVINEKREEWTKRWNREVER
ncbi:ABC transporter substrate-binding protein [Bradyrhizobium diazoefficiens USDA 110]|uniref:ABC transporter substrate-binding protein n=2 Tax=Bradyrhizobium diazoefficiens TaxID=1355477 RepID=Q89E90_BRADU|nr:ABC transporter substrate-binding protein [Bradyrhizobium diazoefficiens]QBP25942.1 ABC transporter substrate-binding protein [Bradyrhizobium diazoefficiens]BAC52462.1 ABC transporter substrate-binding protein [Bradyrhizobium diazoefficiens USDA 110]